MRIYIKSKETGAVAVSGSPFSRHYGVVLMIAFEICDQFRISEAEALDLLETCTAERPIELRDCIVWTSD